MSENRIKVFKNKSKDQSEMRRRRGEVTIELRKSKREDQLSKRRMVGDVSPLKETNNNISLPTRILPLGTVVEYIKSGNEDKLFEAVQSTRKMLSKERNPPIDDVIAFGLVPELMNILDRFDKPSLQFEAAWALTNIASGTADQTRVVVNGGQLKQDVSHPNREGLGIKKFINLLSSPHANVSEQAVWALGNIAGDGPALRDIVLNQGGMNPLLALINPGVAVQFLRNVTWTLSNLCRNKNPPPNVASVMQALPALAYLIEQPDKEVVADACWALSYLTDGSNDRIQLVIDSGVVPKLVSLLGSTEVNILTPALRACGNIVTGTDIQTQMILECNALCYFQHLLTHRKASVVKEAAWAISNITAGNESQIEMVKKAGLVPLIIEVLRKKNDFKSQKEAVWAITNYTSGASPQQILYLTDCGVLQPMCDLLTVKEPKIVLVLLDAFNNIFKNIEKISKAKLEEIAIKVEEYEGLGKIEDLQYNSNEQVYLAALNIINRFFSEDEANIAQPESTSEGFKFTANQQVIPAGGFTFA